ncbi:MAG: hypothetical protein E6R04_04010 [Spirochaetes bacterium]|nr:MAG: hypothetical protein E6R04_04010 [Spirochaetota bacterium]
MFKDIVRIADQGFLRLVDKMGRTIAGDSWVSPQDNEKSVVEIKGWVHAFCRERGKVVPGSVREGFNIWTNTGREFLALLMSIETGPTTAFRNDRMAYIGVGTGATTEDVGVLRLVTPIEYQTGQFLAPLNVPPTFPLTPSRTTVRYSRTFAENEITLSPGTQVNITEMGLFTNGSPTAVPAFNPGTRQTGIATAGSQSPNAYKTLEPIGKTDSLEFEVNWEIRF